MDLTTVFSAIAALAAVATACIAFAALRPAQRVWLQSVSKTWASRSVFFVVIGYSMSVIVVFWLSDLPISRGSIVVLLLSFFNVTAWLGLALLSAMEKRLDARRARMLTLESTVTALTAQVALMERSRT